MLDCLTAMGSILLVVGKVVEEMVRQETSLTNTAAESQGTCISDVHQLPFLDFTSAMLVVLNLTWRSLPVSLAAMAFLKLITNICFFLMIPVTSPKLSKNFLTMMSFSQLVVAS